MSNIILKRLKKGLPYHKNKIISKRLSKKKIDLTSRQVKAVFNGEITDPEIVHLVLKEAKRLKKETHFFYKYKMNATKRKAA